MSAFALVTGFKAAMADEMAAWASVAPVHIPPRRGCVPRAPGWRRRTRARGELAAYYKMQDWAAGFLIIPVGFFSVLFLLKVTHQDRRRFDRQAKVGAKGEFADSLFLFQYRTFGLLVGREYVLG